MRYDPTKDPDDGKLKELILFLSSRSERDQRFGATKLNKLLFYCDFIAYETLGTSMTGHEYQRLPRGPAPKQLVPIRDEMVENGDLALQETSYHGLSQKRPIALRKPRVNVFTGEEIDLVTRVLDALWHKNAKRISDLSHHFEGWKLAREHETIPYEVALVQFAKPRKRDMEKALAIGNELASLRKERGADDLP